MNGSLIFIRLPYDRFDSLTHAYAHTYMHRHVNVYRSHFDMSYSCKWLHFNSMGSYQRSSRYVSKGQTDLPMIFDHIAIPLDMGPNLSLSQEGAWRAHRVRAQSSSVAARDRSASAIYFAIYTHTHTHTMHPIPEPSWKPLSHTQSHTKTTRLRCTVKSTCRILTNFCTFNAHVHKVHSHTPCQLCLIPIHSRIRPLRRTVKNLFYFSRRTTPI